MYNKKFNMQLENLQNFYQRIIGFAYNLVLIFFVFVFVMVKILFDPYFQKF